MSESRSKSRCRSSRWWLAPRLTFEYHNQTGTCFTNTKNYCHRNKLYVLTSLLIQIYLQPALCAPIYCALNKVCYCCHHRKFTSWRTHEQRCCYPGFEMTSQLLPLTLEWKNVTQTKQRHDMRLTSWLKSWLKRISMIFLCEYDLTWTRTKSPVRLGPGPSLKSRLLVNIAPYMWLVGTFRSIDPLFST